MKIFVHLMRDAGDADDGSVTVCGQTLDFVTRGNATVEVKDGDRLFVDTPPVDADMVDGEPGS